MFISDAHLCSIWHHFMFNELLSKSFQVRNKMFLTTFTELCLLLPVVILSYHCQSLLQIWKLNICISKGLYSEVCKNSFVLCWCTTKNHLKVFSWFPYIHTHQTKALKLGKQNFTFEGRFPPNNLTNLWSFYDPYMIQVN